MDVVIVAPLLALLDGDFHPEAVAGDEAAPAAVGATAAKGSAARRPTRDRRDQHGLPRGDAAAEAAVGLGIIIAFFRNKETVNVDEVDLLKW